METLKAIYARIKAVGRRVQAKAVIAGLWLLYWLGFGPVRALMVLFRSARLHDVPADAPTFWLDVPAADYNLDQLTHQS
jgi:hypothetical protein